MTQTVPAGLPALVRHYRGRTQPPVAVIDASWRRALTDHDGLADAALGLWSPTSRNGRSQITRAELHRACGSLDLADPFAVRVAFAVVVMWGAGTSGNRAQRYLPMALSDPRCDETLADTAALCRKEDLAAGYRRFQLDGMGRSFFTKWLAFGGRTAQSRIYPLILDDRVFRTLGVLGVSTLTLAGTRQRDRRYAAYVHALHEWAAAPEIRELDNETDAERLEWILFLHNGAKLPA